MGQKGLTPADPEGARTTTTGQLHQLYPLVANKSLRFGLPGPTRTHAVKVSQSKK